MQKYVVVYELKSAKTSLASRMEPYPGGGFYGATEGLVRRDEGRAILIYLSQLQMKIICWLNKEGKSSSCLTDVKPSRVGLALVHDVASVVLKNAKGNLWCCSSSGCRQMKDEM